MVTVMSKQTLELENPQGKKKIIRCFDMVGIDESFCACNTYQAALRAGVLTQVETRREESLVEQEPEKPYSRMTKKELEKICEERGVDASGCKTKDDLLVLLTGHKEDPQDKEPGEQPSEEEPPEEKKPEAPKE